MFGRPVKDNRRTNYCDASKAADNTTDNRRGAVGGDGQCLVSRFVRLESIWRSTNLDGVDVVTHLTFLVDSGRPGIDAVIVDTGRAVVDAVTLDKIAVDLSSPKSKQ